MKLLYKDKNNNPCIWIKDKSGYFYFEQNAFNRENLHGKIDVRDNIEYIKPENSKYFFPEIDAINKINNNEEGYFDFSKSMIDIGANVGAYTLYTNFNFNYCFEANAIVYHLLGTNLILHEKFEKCKLYNVALYDSITNLEFDGARCKLDGTENVFYDLSHEDDYTRYIDTVRTHILDEYSLNDIGFIKIDVEGMEETILRGGLATIIKNNYPPILFELWDVGKWGMTQEKHDSLQAFLEGLGYEIKWYWGDFETHLAIHK